MSLVQNASLATYFTASAAKHPSRTALCAPDGRNWTYAELHRRALAVARHLNGLGAGPGAHVAVLGGRTADTVVALLGVLHADAAYTVLDPAMPAARREEILAALAPAAVVMTEPGALAPGKGSTAVVLLEQVEDDPDGSPPRAAQGMSTDLAYVMFTSGTTGRPKGIMVEHGSVLNMLRSYEDLAPSQGGFAATLLAPPSFDVSVWEIFSTLLYGGTLHVPAADVVLDGDLLWRFFSERGIRSAYVPAGLLDSVIRAAGVLPGRLSRVLVGVEPIAQGTLDSFRAACPGLRIVNGYGPTETTITATLHLVDRVTDADRRTPIGRAVLGSRVELVDERLRPVGQGDVGEILVSGACLARGYLGGDPGGFVDLPTGRAFRTGDQGRLLPDGSLEFAGRRDGQIKISGVRIETEEVEAALNALPEVRRSLVIATGAPGSRRLIAAVEAPQWLEPTAIRERVSARLPVHAVPSLVVVAPSFPLTENGKVDTGKLLAMARRRPKDAPPYVRPGTALECALADAWSRVLGIDEIGLDDDFHHFGGTSLDAIRIASTMRQSEWPVSARTVLSARTVRGIAAEAGQARATTPCDAPQRAVAPGHHQASRAQEGLYAWRELNPDSARSTVVHAIRLDGAVEPSAIRAALNSLVARHETLRTTFAMDHEGHLRQRVAETAAGGFTVARCASETDVDDRILELLDRRFDVGVQAWTAELLLWAGCGALVFAADHLVFDGESATLLQHDLARALDAEADAEHVAGPASLVATSVRPERAAELRAYWKAALEGFSDQPALPEAPGASHGGRRLRRVVRDIDAVTWTAVGDLARRSRTTPFVVVLAALKAFLRERSNAPANTVAVTVSQRDALNAPDAMGHFVNLVPVHDLLDGAATADLTFEQYVRDVVGLFRRAVAHSDLPYEEIIAQLPMTSPRRTAGPVRVVMAEDVQSAAGESHTVGGTTLRPWPLVPYNSVHDLTLYLGNPADRRAKHLEWVGDPAKVLEEPLEGVADAFSMFLGAAVRGLSKPLNTLPATTPGERGLAGGQPAVPGGTEAVLTGHPRVRSAVVYTREETRTDVLLAAVEATGVDGAELRDWLAERVPDHHLPAKILVVDDFPVMENGKLDYDALHAVRTVTGAGRLGDPMSPRDETEKLLARMWAEVLELPEVGLDDDVFRLGATSMTVLTVATRLSRDANRQIPAHLFYSATTVRALAARIEAGGASGSAAASKAASERAKILRRAARMRGERTQ